MKLNHRFARGTILALFPTLWGISVLNMAAKPSNWVSKRAIANGVEAELSYQKNARTPKYQSVRLKIWQGGQVVFNEAVSRQQNSDQPLLEQSPDSLKVQDLDNDRHPEIIADFYTGGAHCCYYSLIYRFDPNQHTYTPTQHNWGNGFYRLSDSNYDGVMEFEGQDDRFSGRFTSFSGSAQPMQIWRFQQGRMLDVTRQFPRLVEASATRNLLLMQKTGQAQIEPKGAIAAFLADKHSQNQGEEGWQLIQQLYKGDDKEKFFEDLDKFLTATKYTNSPQSESHVPADAPAESES
jgi:hypothetical protein